MRHDEREPQPCYRGAWVKFDRDGLTYTVWIDPAPPGEIMPLHFGAKHEAWAQALWWAREKSLPLRDLTAVNADKVHD